MKKIFLFILIAIFAFANSMDRIEEWKEEVIKTDPRIPGIGEYGNKMYFFSAMTTVVPVTSKNFAEALNNAYQKAYLDILGQCAMSLYGKNLVDQAQELGIDQSDNALEFNDNQNVGTGFGAKIKTLMNKLLLLGDKKLDEALMKLGVSKEQLEKLNPVEKKELFKNKFIQNVLNKTMGDIRGVIVVRSKWILDDDGYATVGVIAKRTPITVQIANAIARKQPINLKMKSDIDFYLNGTPKELISKLGTRIAFDKDGYPVIVSYGISGYQKSHSRYKNDMLRNVAYKRAISQANAQIALFTNGFLSRNFKTITGDIVSEYAQKVVNSDEEPQIKDIQSIIKKTFETTKVKASLDLRGSYVAKRYSYNLKVNENTSVPLVGAIVVWKYSVYENLKNMNKPHMNLKNNVSKKVNSAIESQEFEEKVPEVINDF